TRSARHAWISDEPPGWDTAAGVPVHERCNLGARARWGIEDSMNTEKHRGYRYEHAFSYNWNAMRGFHYLMRLAHAMNALALGTRAVARQVREMGQLAYLDLVRETCANPWLAPEWCRRLLATPFQLRLE
ncbi:MAG: hypothetical protein GY778_12080, partial [bacterium]|nr:hypothetical protein [bacterium]